MSIRAVILDTKSPLMVAAEIVSEKLGGKQMMDLSRRRAVGLALGAVLADARPVFAQNAPATPDVLKASIYDAVQFPYEDFGPISL